MLFHQSVIVDHPRAGIVTNLVFWFLQFNRSIRDVISLKWLQQSSEYRCHVWLLKLQFPVYLKVENVSKNLPRVSRCVSDCLTCNNSYFYLRICQEGVHNVPWWCFTSKLHISSLNHLHKHSPSPHLFTNFKHWKVAPQRCYLKR